MTEDITQEHVKKLHDRLNKDAESAGYHLNPDEEFTEALVRGLAVNEERYGYQSCPCRLSTGDIEKDRDIICPCDYRDADLGEYGSCYCGLYVDDDILHGNKELTTVPERRNLQEPGGQKETGKKDSLTAELKLPVWRCRVCGYLCGREEPPGVCPICKAKKDRFERFL